MEVDSLKDADSMKEQISITDKMNRFLGFSEYEDNQEEPDQTSDSNQSDDEVRFQSKSHYHSDMDEEMYCESLLGKEQSYKELAHQASLPDQKPFIIFDSDEEKKNEKEVKIKEKTTEEKLKNERGRL
jgi:hypothetical protein